TLRVRGLGANGWANPALLCVPDHEAPLLSSVVFCMSFVQGEEETNKIPVALGLKGKNLYLSCGMKDGKPILQLESVKPNTYPKRKMEKRFVFNKLEINHKCEFESAMYPNWYISTSRSELQPIFLGNTRSSENITDFIMELA
ncbi:PREDICTED: interleukin-1 beta-like, partial [Ceratotherium simum simum]|uniref:Multifunctional fusion protein n=1 Tax=Ceratotherium simum simum TaxID=73337 RepID=A0ABM1D5H4_CERSS